MKIAIDCRMLGSGGIGSYLQALIPLFLKDNECLLFGSEKDLNQYKVLPDVKLVPCDLKPFSFNDNYHFPKDLLKEINTYDVYYTPYCNIPNGIKIPIFSTIHDVVFLDLPELVGKFGTIVRKIFYKRAIHKSNLIFTVSEFSKQRITTHLKPGKKNLVVTYNALPPWFNNSELNDIEKEEYILFVGNIKKHKGLHTLLEAYKECLSKGFTGKLKIVGNADNFRSSDNHITEEIQKLGANVEFTGRISDEQLNVTYKKAKILVQPSLYEGFGMPPLEALSLGTNAVISDIPVFQEIYEKLPVTFFKKENSQDLAEKIMNSYNSTVPEILENPYSFERTYKIIINTIKDYLKD